MLQNLIYLPSIFYIFIMKTNSRLHTMILKENMHMHQSLYGSFKDYDKLMVRHYHCLPEVFFYYCFTDCISQTLLINKLCQNSSYMFSFF